MACDQPLTVKPGHENNTVDTHLPLLTEHNLRFLPERRRSCIALLAQLLGLYELLRLRKADTDQAHRDGKAGRDPEYSLPRLDCTAHAQVCASCANVTE